ncbi:MAG: hypothetical protein ACT4PM_04365 [Gemmatimonadales bacterium]
MGLDIRFDEDDPAAVELDGARLTSLPGFLNLIRMVGPVLNHLNDPSDAQNVAIYQGAERYAREHPEAAELFQQYLAFAARFREQVPEESRSQLDFSSNPEDYDPVARTFMTALMLREAPMDGEEAEKVLPITSFLATFSRVLLAIPHPGIEPDQVQWAIQVLEKYNRCLEVATETNASFHISF